MIAQDFHISHGYVEHCQMKTKMAYTPVSMHASAHAIFLPCLSCTSVLYYSLLFWRIKTVGKPLSDEIPLNIHTNMHIVLNQYIILFKLPNYSWFHWGFKRKEYFQVYIIIMDILNALNSDHICNYHTQTVSKCHDPISFSALFVREIFSFDYHYKVIDTWTRQTI